MNFLLNFPLFLIVSCLVCAAVSSLLSTKGARRVTACLTTASTVVNILLFLYTHAQNSYFEYMMGHFPHPWGNELRISPLASFYSALFSFVLLLCIIGGKSQLDMKIQEKKGRYFYILCDLIQVSLLVLAYTNDIFTGYVFVEICTLASTGILCIRDNGRSILASMRYMIYSQVGSGLFLFGVVFLYNITGNLLMPELKESIANLWATGQYRLPLLTAICFICIGLGIKSGLFPFHIWMSDTYGTAIPAASGILSGLVSKGYIFFLIKIILDVFGEQVFYESGIDNVLYVLGACGILFGSIGAIRENNIFRMLAYSSAAQIGYIYMGIGLSATAGIEASLFQVAAHALTKPALFLAAGHLSYTMGRAKKFHNLQGAAHLNRLAGITFTLESLSMIGIPLTMGFIAKYLFGMAAFGSSVALMIPTLLVLAVSTILNTLYFARTIIRIYNRPLIDMKTLSDDAPRLGRIQTMTIGQQKSYAVAGILFAVLNVTLGIFSQHFIHLISNCISLL